MTVSAACYLYVVEQSSSGRVRILFPDPQNSVRTNPISAEARLPEDSTKSFKVMDDSPGSYTVYVLASRWPQTRMDDFIAVQDSQNGPDTVMDILNKADRFASSIGGLSFGKYSFSYEPLRANRNVSK
jgi:hypothetical protein